MGKDSVYVYLVVNNGAIDLKFFKGGIYGDWVKILEWKKLGRSASIIAGAVGIKYSCKFIYDDKKEEINLYDEGEYTWFIENDDIPNKNINEKNKYCPYCYQEIKKPISDKHQGRVSLVCPHCGDRLEQW